MTSRDPFLKGLAFFLDVDLRVNTQNDFKSSHTLRKISQLPQRRLASSLIPFPKPFQEKGSSLCHWDYFHVCVCVCVCVCAQSCLTLCNPMHCSLPGSSVHGVLIHCSGLPFPSPGDLPHPGMEPGSPALQADSLPSEPPGKPCGCCFSLTS